MITLVSGQSRYSIKITYKENAAILIIMQGDKTHEIILSDYVIDRHTGRVSFALGQRRISFMLAQAGLHDWRVYAVGGCTPYAIAHERSHTLQPYGMDTSFYAKDLVRQPDQAHMVTSPLAGKISKVFVSPGQIIKKNQPMLLIDAMKMENEICADQDGIIKNVFIAPGDLIQPNHILVEFSREGEGHGTTKTVDAVTPV